MILGDLSTISPQGNIYNKNKTGVENYGLSKESRRKGYTAATAEPAGIPAAAAVANAAIAANAIISAVSILRTATDTTAAEEWISNAHATECRCILSTGNAAAAAKHNRHNKHNLEFEKGRAAVSY